MKGGVELFHKIGHRGGDWERRGKKGGMLTQTSQERECNMVWGKTLWREVLPERGGGSETKKKNNYYKR